MTKNILVMVVLCSLAGVASAGDRDHQGGGRDGGRDNTPTKHFNAPEIDPASAGSALTLLMGGLAVLRSRVSRKK